jgi:gramicidin S synthase 2/tyrocidine synthetase-3
LVPPQGEEVEVGETLIEWEYNTDIFDAETIERMSSHYVRLLEAVVAAPSLSAGELPMLCEAEIRQLLYEFNDTRRDYPRDRTVSELFEEQAAMRPDRVAVVDMGTGDAGPAEVSLSYSQLNQEANRLGRLLQSKGVAPGVLVALLADRSIEMMVAILGVLKAGGAYLPIDPEYPLSRIRYMLEDSSAGIVLIQSHARETGNIETTLPLDRIYLDEPVRDETGAGDGNLVSSAGSGDLAYVMYTSGSTGRPKGVMVEHRNVVRLVKNSNFIEFDETIRLLQTGAPVFDAVTFEMWGPLLNGGQLFFSAKEVILDASRLGAALFKHCINTLWLSASLFNQLTRQDSRIYSNLHYLLVGGDVLAPRYINEARETHKHLKIINGYGPTENTTFSTTFRVNGHSGKSIPIGSPIGNSSAYILGINNRLQPIGVYGELCVGGDGVSRGYLNQPELTADKFVSSPFTLHPSILYKTGDLARWLPDGNIEFMGRLDHQVKIRGFRIELEEIEYKLTRYDGVREAAVLCREDNEGDKYLCAYVVSSSPVDLDLPGLREFLVGELPVYMVPAYIVPLESFPLNISGKLDRGALPSPSDANAASEKGANAAPTTAVEVRMIEIWSRVLNLSPGMIGVDTDFFQCGGHSLKAATLVLEMQKAFNVNVSLIEVFINTTVKELSAYVEHAVREFYIPIEPAPSRKYWGLSSAQKRIFIEQQVELQSTVYNIPAVLVVEGKIDYRKVENAFKELIRRHESLRTSFKFIDNEPVQEIHETVDFAICFPVSGTAPLDTVIRSFIQPFDLSQAPLMRVGLIKQEDKKHILIIDMHHIISDGTSMVIFEREFVALYKEIELPALRIQYKDFSEWQNSESGKIALEKAEEYWLNRFKGDLPVLDLSTDYPRTLKKTFEGQSFYFEADSQLTEALKQLAAGSGATLYMVLLAAYYVLLSRYTGQEDIIVGSPAAGRQHPDLQPVLGMFLNTLALRNYPVKDKPFDIFLEEVKTDALLAFQYQQFKFETLVEKLGVKRVGDRHPLFDTMFILQNIGRPDVVIHGITFKSYPISGTISKFDITLEAFDESGKLRFRFEYRTHLFKNETIKRMADDYLRVLEAITENRKVELKEISFSPQVLVLEKAVIDVEFNI